MQKKVSYISAKVHFTGKKIACLPYVQKSCININNCVQNSIIVSLGNINYSHQPEGLSTKENESYSLRQPDDLYIKQDTKTLKM